MVDIFLSSFLVYKYWLLFGVCVFAAFGVPLPATALLIAWGALYAQGYFDIMTLFWVGFSGCVIGDIFGYSLSYVYGKDIFIRMRLTWFIHIDGILEKYGPSFIRKSIFTVFITRWAVTWLWPSVNIIAWLTKMRPTQFLFTDIIGEILYISIYVSIGYSFGNGWEEILDVIESFSSMIVTGVLLWVGLYFFWKQSRKKQEISEMT
jgi:membrane-associated protein